MRIIPLPLIWQPMSTRLSPEIQQKDLGVGRRRLKSEAYNYDFTCTGKWNSWQLSASSCVERWEINSAVFCSQLCWHPLLKSISFQDRIRTQTQYAFPALENGKKVFSYLIWLQKGGGKWLEQCCISYFFLSSKAWRFFLGCWSHQHLPELKKLYLFGL